MVSAREKRQERVRDGGCSFKQGILGKLSEKVIFQQNLVKMKIRKGKRYTRNSKYKGPGVGMWGWGTY